MVALSNHIYKAAKLQAFASFRLGLLYRGLIDAAFDGPKFLPDLLGYDLANVLMVVPLLPNPAYHEINQPMYPRFPYGEELTAYCWEGEDNANSNGVFEELIRCWEHPRPKMDVSF